MRRPLTVMSALLSTALLVCPAAAQDPATFYEDNCASCHTIGGGVLGGPDLKGVTTRRDREWLIRFLLDPEAFRSDPAVIQMIKESDGLEMGPTEGLTRELAEAILQLIEQQSNAGDPAAAAQFAPFSAEEEVAGRHLFTGTQRLGAGGPACVSCHHNGDVSFRGGRLGPDLVNLHERLGGGRGVTAWLKATQSPMMRSLYKDRRLNDDEARALAAFLESVPPVPPPGRTTAPHVVAGFIGSLLTVGLIGGVWTRRFRAVRRPLVDGARRPLGPESPKSSRHALGGPG